MHTLLPVFEKVFMAKFLFWLEVLSATCNVTTAAVLIKEALVDEVIDAERVFTRS